jgi:RHS repeat-associated protein
MTMASPPCRVRLLKWDRLIALSMSGTAWPTLSRASTPKPTTRLPTRPPARPTGYGAVPDYRPVALANGANLAQSSAWRGHWVDITGYYQVGARTYDPIAGNWLSYDPVWNERDPNAYTFCGGDPINGVDSDGRCVENTPPNLYMGTAPVMETSLQTTTYFQDGRSVTTTGPQIFDPNLVAGNSYNVVTQPTGQYQYYVSQNALPADYGQTTVTPITTYQVEQQQDLQFLAGTATILATVATDTEELAPDLLAADDTAFTSTINKVSTLDFSTSPNGAVFYSGPGQGAKAAAFANQTGRMTIEMTPGGQQLMADPVFQSLSPAQQYHVWQAASTPFAQGASGSVNVFANGARATGTFRTIEEPILTANPNVFKYTYH